MNPQVQVEISNRHCHVSQQHLELLFGKGYQLKKLKDLSQPGQYAAEETLNIKTPGGVVEKVRILGPCRDFSQVELSVTDARKVKVKPVFRHSGKVENTPGCTLVGPKGEVAIDKGVIVAMRHIHCDLPTAAKHGFKDGQTVKVRVGGERGVVFENVLLRVHKDFAFYMHVDTDEGNAALTDAGGSTGEILAG